MALREAEELETFLKLEEEEFVTNKRNSNNKRKIVTNVEIVEDAKIPKKGKYFA